MKRLLMVISDLQTGGAERHVSLLAPALKARGYDVTVYVFGKGRDMAAPLTDARVPIIDGTMWARRFEVLPSPARGLMMRAAMIAQLAAHLRRHRYDLHHAFLPQPCVFLGLAARLACVRPVVLSRRSMNDYRAQTPWEWRIEKVLMAHADLVLGNAEAICAQLAQEEGVPTARLACIPNGVDPAAAFEPPADRAASRRGEGISEHAFVMVMVAGLSPRKGHQVLFEALRRADSRLPSDWLLLCAGGGDPAFVRDLERQAAGFAGRVRVLGRRADVHTLNALADLGLLCPIHSEGMSNSVLEGMAAGLPFVVTDVGGNAELVAAGQTGMVVPAGDADALADALVALANDPAGRAAMGAAARRRITDEFSFDLCADRYDRTYRALSAGAPLPPEVACT